MYTRLFVGLVSPLAFVRLNPPLMALLGLDFCFLFCLSPVCIHLPPLWPRSPQRHRPVSISQANITLSPDKLQASAIFLPKYSLQRYPKC